MLTQQQTQHACARILYGCHLFKDHQYILEDISPSIYPSDILRSHKGIQSLAEFLHAYGQE